MKARIVRNFLFFRRWPKKENRCQGPDNRAYVGPDGAGGLSYEKAKNRLVFTTFARLANEVPPF